MDTVRSRQLLSYSIAGVEQEPLPLDFTDAPGDIGTSWTGLDPMLVEWLGEHCNYELFYDYGHEGDYTQYPYSGYLDDIGWDDATGEPLAGRSCSHVEGRVHNYVCAVGTLLELAAAVGERQLHAWNNTLGVPEIVTVLPQSRETRAALSEAAVRLISSYVASINWIESLDTWVDSASESDCVDELPAFNNATRLELIASGMRELHELSLEAADRAARDYIAIADGFGSGTDGEHDRRTVRLHAARFLVGQGGWAHRRTGIAPAQLATQAERVNFCRTGVVSLHARVALGLIREAGMDPSFLETATDAYELVDATTDGLRERTLRILGRTDELGMSVDQFLSEYDIELDEIEEARSYLVQELEAFSRDSSVIDPARAITGAADPDFFAATAFPPSPLPSVYHASVARASGLVTTIDTAAPGFDPQDALDQAFANAEPTVANVGDTLKRIAYGLIEAAENVSYDDEVIEAGLRIAASASDVHEGWLYGGNITSGSYVPEALVVSPYGENELVAVESLSALRCALEGRIEGVPCDWADTGALVGDTTTSAWSSQTGYLSTLAEPDLIGPRPPWSLPAEYVRFTGISGPLEALYVLRLKPGAPSLVPGSYEALGSVPIYQVDSNARSVVRTHLVPSLDNRLAAILGVDPDRCDRAVVTCEQLQLQTPFDGRIPLEDELTDDGDQFENSWRRYLQLARQAADEADLLGQQALDQELDLQSASEDAFEQLADLCGPNIDTATLATVAAANPGKSVLEILDLLPSGPSRTVLERCAGDSSVVPVVGLGSNDLCLWRDENDGLCGWSGPGEPDLPCPRWAQPDDYQGSTLTCDRYPSGASGFTPVPVGPDTLLRFLTPTTRPAGTIPPPNFCVDYRLYREAVEMDVPSVADIDWTRVFRDAAVFSVGNVPRLARQIAWKARPGDFSVLLINDRPLLATGLTSVGPDETGLCEPGGNVTLKAAASCDPYDNSSLLCSSYDCTDPSERAALNLRLMKAAMFARWLGGQNLQGFVTLQCGNTSHAGPLSFTEDYQQFILGTYTREDQQGVRYYCNPPGTNPSDPLIWNSGCGISCAGGEGRQGIKFRELDGDHYAYGNIANPGVGRLDSARGEAARWLDFFRSRRPSFYMDFPDPWEVVSPLPWFAADSCDGGLCGLSSFWSEGANGVNRQTILDAFELLCEASQIENPNAALNLPTTISPSDVEGLADLIAHYAEGIKDQGTLMVVRDLPSEFVDEFQGSQVSTAPSGFRGLTADTASRARDALLRLRSLPESTAEELDGLSRDVKQVMNIVRRFGLEEKLRNLGLASAISDQLSTCAVAAIEATKTSFGPDGPINKGAQIAQAAVTCANSVFQIVTAVRSKMVADDIADIDLENALIDFIEIAARRASTIRQVGDAFLFAQNDLHSALEAMNAQRLQARRAMANALFLTDSSTAVRFSSNSGYQLRRSTTFRRYERARLDAIRMAFLAKLAIEQRFGVSLADISHEMTLVDAPSGWEADVCKLQGINYSQIQESNPDIDRGYDDRFIGEYVSKLESFVDSYRIDFPFVDGSDSAVISLRDDIHNVSAECTVPAGNLLAHSNDLTNLRTPGRRGWESVGCAEDAQGVQLPNCISSAEANAEPLAVFAQNMKIFDLEFGPEQSLCSPDCGWQLGARFAQELTLQAGTYRVTFHAQNLPPAPPPADPIQALLDEVERAKDVVRVRFADNSVLKGTDLPSTVVAVQNAGTPGVDYWGKYSYAFTLTAAETLSLELHPFEGLATPVSTVRVAGIALERIDPPSSGTAPALPVEFIETDESGGQQIELCEDTDGSEFRSRVWIRGCVNLCQDGFAGACLESHAQEYCYRETEVTVTQRAIDRGTLFGNAGFARGNFNYRIDRVGLNFVGSAARDCQDSSRPSTCYSAGFVPYSIEHLGPFPVRNNFGDDFDAPLFTGVIEHARGLATERYVTNPLSSADRALIDPYMQSQFRGRPIAGRYRIRVWEEEGVNFDGIEDVQLVLNYRYWTRTR